VTPPQPYLPARSPAPAATLSAIRAEKPADDGVVEALIAPGVLALTLGYYSASVFGLPSLLLPRLLTRRPRVR
jgi:hypothetical protein